MSRNFRTFSIATFAITGVALIATSFVPKAHADEWNKMTIVTVNEPIIAGNKVLDPGTYVWKLMDSPSDRHIVQIFDKNQQHLETTVLAIPDYRMQPTGKTQFAFWETPAGVPKAVRDWFYPGDNYGQEFPYPKKLVAQLASAQPVPVPENYREPEPAPAPEPQPAPEAQPAPQPAPEPQAAPAPQTQPAPQQPTTVDVGQPKLLPHTGSFNPLIGLLGLSSLSFAGLLTLATRRS
jgi:LPXTG-motif cell wall-anchored protein